MPLILPRRNRLAYPAGRAPGVDPRHPAAQNLSKGHGFSAIAYSKQLLQAISGRPFDIIGSGTPNNGIDAKIGSYYLPDPAGATYLQTAVGSTVADTESTLAAIIHFQVGGSPEALIGASANTVPELYTDSSKLLTLYGTTVTSSGLALTTGNYYFIAASSSTVRGQSNFVILDLSSGSLRSAVVGSSAGTGANTNGVFTVGTDGFGNISKSKIAAAMYSPTFLSMQQLLQWADSPWEFWFPAQPLALRDIAIPPTTRTVARSGWRPPRRSKLAYPEGVAAGVDPNHIAGQPLFSVTARSNNFTNLLSGRIGANIASVPNAVEGIIGPSLSFDATGNQSIQFSGQTTATIKNYTIAAIFQISSFNAVYNGIFESETSGSASYLAIVTSGGNRLTTGFYGGTDFPSNISLSTNTPYFGIASVTNTSGTSYTVNFTVVNLATGQIRTNTTSGTSSVGAGNGIFLIGQLVGGFSTNGYISAIAFTQTPLSLAQQLRWADDPWSFWYPERLPLRDVALPADVKPAARSGWRPPRRSKLAYPEGVAAGVDPGHPAARGLTPGTGMAAVANGNNHVSLLSGAKFSQTGGNQTAVMNGQIGPSVNFTSTDCNSIAGISTATPSAMTFAVIFTPTNVGATSILISDQVSGFILFDYQSNELSLYINSLVIFSSGLTLSNDTPYFLAASQNSTTASFIAKDLKTGAVRTSIVSSIPFIALSGTLNISFPNFNGAKGPVACAYVNTTRALNIQELRQWADDPWGFWYPQRQKYDLAELFPPTTVYGPAFQPGAFQFGAFQTTYKAGASVGAAAGVGTANAVGVALYTATGAASGVGAATATGAALASGAGSAAGTGAATGRTASQGAAAGTGAANGVGASLFTGVGSAAGTGTAAAKAQSIGSAAGTSTVNGVSAALATSAGSAAGTGTATGFYAAAAAGAAAGTGTATATGAALSVATGSAAGASTATATGVSAASTTGTAAGTSTIAGRAAGQGAAAGLGTATAASLVSAVSAGSAAGVGSASAIAGAALLGSASGVGSASGAITAITAIAGSAAGTSTVTATGASVASSAGSAAGTSSVLARSQSIGSAAGVGTATGAGAYTVVATGNAAGVGSATGFYGATSSGTAAGVGSATATGASVASAAGSAAGTSTAQAFAVSIGSAAGTSTVSGVGASLFTATGNAAGTGTATATTGVFGTAAGVGTATGVGAAKIAAQGAAAGQGTATAVGQATALSQGSAAGVGSASSVALAVGKGTAAGTSTVAAVGLSLNPRAGVAAGLGTANAVGRSSSVSAGQAAGLGTALGIVSGVVSARGQAAGTSMVLGVSKTKDLYITMDHEAQQAPPMAVTAQQASPASRIGQRTSVKTRIAQGTSHDHP